MGVHFFDLLVQAKLRSPAKSLTFSELHLNHTKFKGGLFQGIRDDSKDLPRSSCLIATFPFLVWTPTPQIQYRSKTPRDPPRGRACRGLWSPVC